MLCEICRTGEATGYIEENISGQKHRIHLCSKCLDAKKREIFGVGLFSGFVEPTESKTTIKRCNNCGTELKTIISTLFVGCEQCYTNLRNELLPLIKNIQGADKHE